MPAAATPPPADTRHVLCVLCVLCADDDLDMEACHMSTFFDVLKEASARPMQPHATSTACCAASSDYPSSMDAAQRSRMSTTQQLLGCIQQA